MKSMIFAASVLILSCLSLSLRAEEIALPPEARESFAYAMQACEKTHREISRSYVGPRFPSSHSTSEMKLGVQMLCEPRPGDAVLTSDGHYAPIYSDEGWGCDGSDSETQYYCRAESAKSEYWRPGHRRGGWMSFWYRLDTQDDYSISKSGSNLGPPQCPMAFGNPINAATGNKYQKATDLFGTGASILKYERHYNSSILQQPTSNGWGWSHTFSTRVHATGGPATMRVVRDDGRYIDFSLSGGIYRPQDASLGSLVDRGASEQERWEFSDNKSMEIDRYDNRGRLTSRTGLLKRAVLKYAGPESVEIVFAEDETGRRITFTYQNGRVSEILSSDGTGVLYSYDASLGDAALMSAIRSDGTGERYRYGHAGLADVLDENGSIKSTFGYGRAGDAYLTSSQGNLNSYTIYRSSLTSGINIDKIYRLNTEIGSIAWTPINGLAKPTQVSYGLCEGVGDAYQFVYDSAGNLDKTIDFDGNRIDHDIDARGLETRRQHVSTNAVVLRTVDTVWHSAFPVAQERITRSGSGNPVAKNLWYHNTRGQTVSAVAIDPATSETRASSTTYCEQPDVDAGVCPRSGLVTKVDGPRTDVVDATTYTYFPSDDPACAGAPATCARRKGDLWKTTNAMGQETEILKYDGAGRVLSVKDPNGAVTDFEYNARGWITESKQRGADDASEADDRITQIAYWPNDLVKQVTQPDGAFSVYTYDAARRLIGVSDSAGNTIHYTLNNAGKPIKEETKDDGGALRRTLSRVYDKFGQLITQTSAQAATTRFNYEANGRTDTVTDALGRVTGNDYDPLDRLQRTLQNVGGIAAETKFEYDTLDRLTKVTDPKGLATGYKYNAFGDLLELASPDTGITTYVYDSASNRKSRTDARGITATYGYDALNRTVSVSYTDTAYNVSYAYNTVPAACQSGETYAKGQLSSMTDTSGGTAYCYDRFGDLVRKVQTVNGVAFTVRYAYTKAGQLSAVTYPDGSTVDYVRNALGQATEVGVRRGTTGVVGRGHVRALRPGHRLELRQRPQPGAAAGPGLPPCRHPGHGRGRAELGLQLRRGGQPDRANARRQQHAADEVRLRRPQSTDGVQGRSHRHDDRRLRLRQDGQPAVLHRAPGSHRRPESGRNRRDADRAAVDG